MGDSDEHRRKRACIEMSVRYTGEEPRGVNSISHQKYLELCADERIRFGSCNTVTAALADNFTARNYGRTGRKWNRKYLCGGII